VAQPGVDEGRPVGAGIVAAEPASERWSGAQRVGVAESASARSEPGVDFVDAPLWAAGAGPADLVGHRVGESLHRGGGPDAVAVEMQKRVKIGERERTVPPEDRDTGRSEGGPPEPAGVGAQRSERGEVVRGGAAAVVVLDARPELVAEVVEPIEAGDSPMTELEELRVDLSEVGDDRVAFDLSGESSGRGQVRRHAVEDEPGSWAAGICCSSGPRERWCGRFGHDDSPGWNRDERAP